MKKFILTFLRILITALILFFIFRKIDFAGTLSIFMRSNIFYLVLALASFFLIFLASVVSASDQPQDKPYSGDWLSRSTLTGDWGGVRNDLAQKGITFDLKFTQVLQGIVDGGKDSSWESGGRGNLLFNVDTQKLGLWPGGFLTVEVEGNYGTRSTPTPEPSCR